MKRSLLVCALLLSTAMVPARAEDVSNRLDQLEQELRQLTGQVEELTYQLKQLQSQKKLGAVEQPVPQTDQAAASPTTPLLPKAPSINQQAATTPTVVPIPPKKKPTLQEATVQGVEQIDETPVAPTAPQPTVTQAAPSTQVAGVAPAPKPAGLGVIKSAQASDGGFQGKVLVAPGGVAVTTAVQTTTNNANAADGATAQQASVQKLDPASQTPDDLFQSSYQALFQMHYDEAQSGFKSFLEKYPTHDLVGSVDFWMGESYWAQKDFASSAQYYRDSYTKYPKGRRAPESLLKLGLSMAQLGQKDQACTFIASVGNEFPNAVETKKRAQSELKRTGC